MAETIFDARAVSEALDRMAQGIAAAGEEIALLGIQRGGARVADAIEDRLAGMGRRVLRGNLDISFYRDDLDTIGPNPEVRPSRIPFDVTDRALWLVDDVLYTGRTIRAALGEIFDYGRPACVRLAVLVDRGGRELPIAPDLVGLTHIADAGCSVKLVADVPPERWTIESRRVRA